ncbi:ATP-binding protein [Microbacterium sp. GXF7504]
MERAFRPERIAAAEPSPRPLTTWAWPVAAVGIFLLAAVGVNFRPDGANLAMWWPAAGVSVWLVIRAGRDRRWPALAIVFAGVFLGNLVTDWNAVSAAALGLTNAAEALVVSVLLHRHTRAFRVRSVRNALWFIAVAWLGAVVAGAGAATVRALGAGGAVAPADLFVLVVHGSASHLSAVLLIASFAALPARSEAWPRGEVVLQTVLLAFTLTFVFAPGMFLPLSFLPFAFIVWAAFRFPVRFALTQVLVASVIVMALTLADGGPFAQVDLTPRGLMLVVEVYLIVLAVITIMLLAARYAARQAERAALSMSQVITGGFVASRVGLIIAEEEDGRIVVLWANRAAVTVIDPELSADGTWDGPLARIALRSMIEGVEAMHEDRTSGTTVSLVASRIPGEASRFSAQLVDVGATIRTAQARHDAERERAAARSTLVDLERQRDDFVATTSHELRTPVTSIAGYAELLAESPTLSLHERAWVDIIVRNAARLTTLVEDLLTLGRSGIAPPRASELDLGDLAREVVAIHRPMADARRIRLELEVAQGAAAHCAVDDATRALGNLVSNAVKFTPPGGTVRIRSESVDGRVALSVVDTGPGMPPEVLDHAFDRFYRGQDAVQANTPGTGLGLAIAAQLARRNGAEVRLSLPAGGGLAATLVFADPAPAPADRVLEPMGEADGELAPAADADAVLEPTGEADVELEPAADADAVLEPMGE